MSNSPQQQNALQTTETFSSDEFSALLNKEFRPKTDQAKEAVENAVKTPAQQALENTVTVSSDAYRTIRALIAEIDEKLSQQINQIIHHDDFQKLEGAARPALSGQQLRNRRDAEDPLYEHFQTGAGPHAEAL